MTWYEKLPYWSTCKYVYFVFGIVLILMFTYAVLLKIISNYVHIDRMYIDPMNKEIMEVPGIGPISWWPISHFILFLILGVLFPHCDILIIGAGILWELFEAVMSIITAKPHQTVHQASGIQYAYTWWAGSFKDIIFNIAGFYLGKSYRLLWDANIGPLNECCKGKLKKYI